VSSAYLLACIEAQAHGARLAELATDETVQNSRTRTMVGDAAVWALTRQRDSRAVPALRARLLGGRLGFASRSEHSGYGTRFWFRLPGIHEVLAAFGPAPELLRRGRCRDRQGGRRPRSRRRCRALRAAGHVEPGRGTRGTRTASDAERTVGAMASGRGGDRSRPDRTYQVRSMLDSTEPWVRVEAAHALTRITGDTDAAVAVLTQAAAPLADGAFLPVRLAALRYLAELRIPAHDLATAVLHREKRFRYAGSWRGFQDDQTACAAALAILATAE
jgi:hypothetical protein